MNIVSLPFFTVSLPRPADIPRKKIRLLNWQITNSKKVWCCAGWSYEAERRSPAIHLNMKKSEKGRTCCLFACKRSHSTTILRITLSLRRKTLHEGDWVVYKANEDANDEDGFVQEVTSKEVKICFLKPKPDSTMLFFSTLSIETSLNRSYLLTQAQKMKEEYR